MQLRGCLRREIYSEERVQAFSAGVSRKKG